jgi:hypothetical protein
MKTRAALTCAVLLASSLSLSARQAPRQDGRWEVTVDMEMAGMPMKMPSQTITRCVTKEEAADPQKALPQASRDANPNACKVSDYKTVGNTVSWAIKCEGAQPMTGTGELVYGDGTYKGTMKMSMAGGQMMTMKYSGKRLGDCTK